MRILSITMVSHDFGIPFRVQFFATRLGLGLIFNFIWINFLARGTRGDVESKKGWRGASIHAFLYYTQVGFWIPDPCCSLLGLWPFGFPKLPKASSEVSPSFIAHCPREKVLICHAAFCRKILCTSLSPSACRLYCVYNYL